MRRPLPARDEKFILKYFFLRRAGRTDPRARHGSQQAKPTHTDSPGDKQTERAGREARRVAANIRKLLDLSRICGRELTIQRGSGITGADLYRLPSITDDMACTIVPAVLTPVYGVSSVVAISMIAIILNIVIVDNATGRRIARLRRLHREQEPKSPFVFTSERGAPFTTAGFARMIERAGRIAKLSFKAHPHMLRHACGYALANQRPRHKGSTSSPWSQEHPAHMVPYTE